MPSGRAPQGATPRPSRRPISGRVARTSIRSDSMTAAVSRRCPLALLVGLLLLPLAGPSAGAAQTTPGEAITFSIPGEPEGLVDRVVAVAGDSLILLSEVTNEMVLLAAQGARFPEDPDSLKMAAREVLTQLVDMQLVLQAAARDTLIRLDQTETELRVQAQIDAVSAELGGTQALQEALAADGMTMPRYREVLRQRIEGTLIRDLYLRQQFQDLPPVAITESEMRAFFEAQRASLQQRPEILSLEQIVIPVEAPDSMWRRARLELDSLATRILDGESFEDVAREASDDPGSAANGGDLGWFRRGAMVPEFDEIAFSNLPDGQLSPAFRTDYGWHAMRIDRRRPGEVRARHILIRPEPGPDDMGEALARGAEVAERLRAGESIDSLAIEYGHDDQVPTVYPRVPREAIAENLPPGYGQALAGASEGEVIEPFSIQAQGQYVVVLRVDEIREAGEFSYEDVEDQIRERLAEVKNRDRIWERLRDRAYVEIRF